MKESGGVGGVASWAAEYGFGSIDLSDVDAASRKACDDAGIGIGTVDWGVGGALLSKNAATRRKASAAMKKRIRDTAKYGSGVMFLCLSPEDGLQLEPLVAAVHERAETRTGRGS